MSGYIIEFRQVGRFIKVSAADPVSLQETFIVVPAGKGISRSDMTKLAVKRLENILKKIEAPST